MRRKEDAMSTYTINILTEATRVAATYPVSIDFAMDCAHCALIHDGDAVEIASKRINRKASRDYIESLQPVTTDYGWGLTRSPAANLRIVLPL